MKWLGALLVVLTACQTVEQPDAPDMDTVRRAYCGLTDDISYAYDPAADPALTDTIETVEEIRKHNETRNLVCKE
jgi:hypothetical protein